MSLQCFECGAPSDHEHHVIPRSLGGTKTIPLCETHHGIVHDRAMVGHRALTSAGMRAKRARGEYTGGGTQYGYAHIAGKLVEIEHEQDVIREAKRLRVAGLSLRGIAATLNERGMQSRNGGCFFVNQIVRMLGAVEREP